jgi:excisionase family DNA binding protein
MENNAEIPELPGYVSVKEAAKMLGLSERSVQKYVEDRRIPVVRATHVIMIPLEAVQQFKPQAKGRPRKSIPPWLFSPDNNFLTMTSILVQARVGKEGMLMEKLEEIKQSGEHLFPGTIARYFSSSEDKPGLIGIMLIWRSTVMPDENERKQALKAFRQALDDVLDWSTAEYETSRILMHT